MPREKYGAKRERLLERALSFQIPFTISDVGSGLDYEAAGKLLRELHARGDLRKVRTTKAVPIYYTWVND